MAERSVPSFDAAFLGLFQPACRVAARILGPGPAAEDAAAEAMARALVNWHKIESLPYRDAWVMRVAMNVAIDMARRRHPLPVSAEELPDLQEAAVVRVALAAALAALPRRQREVIAMRYLAGFSELDTAAALGISGATVKKHTSRAIAALRHRIGTVWEDDPLAT